MPPPKRSLTATLLILYNVLLLVFAIILLASSAYVGSWFRDTSWSSLMTQGASTAGIIAGVLTALVSLLGLLAASKRQRKLLCAYIVCLVIIISIQLSAATGLNLYSNSFEIRDDSVPSGSLTSTPEIYINNVVFSVYTICCTGCLRGMCTNPELPPTMLNVTNPNCVNGNCTFVQACSSRASAKCFNYNTGAPNVVPPYAVTPSLCNVLAGLRGPRSSRLVGLSSTNACGGGDPTRFLQDLDAWTSAIAMNAAIVFYAIAAIEIVVLLSGFYLICCASRETVAKFTGFNVDEADEDWKA